MGRTESCFPPFSGLETEGKVFLKGRQIKGVGSCWEVQWDEGQACLLDLAGTEVIGVPAEW